MLLSTKPSFHPPSQLIFFLNKDTMQWGQGRLFDKDNEKIRHSHTKQQKNWCSYLNTYKIETRELLEENRRKTPWCLGTNFLDITQAQARKAEIKKWVWVHLKSCPYSREMVNRIHTTHRLWWSICSHTLDKGLISTVHTGLKSVW